MTAENNEKIILELQNICMKYHTLNEETLAIEDLSLNVHDKEFLTIVGPSGCGKSTVLSIISGLLPFSGGEVKFNTQNTEKNAAPVGYMLQRDYLFEWRTIKQNVILGLEIKKTLNDESRAYAVELLKKYGLGEFMDYYPNQLSGGMRQKAALIRTLAVKPKILLLDEPFSALDYQTRINISEEVRNIIISEKKTAILVSHDISEAVSLSDRVVVFSQRPCKVKKILKIDFGSNAFTVHEKHKHEKFNEYFDIIWGELSDKSA